ncbi:uncharacterized protein LOC131957256 [Physella acuta]|uniref:uncharacterized protein LOC131957256 n=1 Tax=Physella acuta TaxID=109671 RepID=UPI0027DD771C|nr:uncharacterized protein LOC131957256 [Physella acuta]
MPEYSFTNRSDDEVNYSMNCSVEIDKHALSIGKYDFDILIYPDLQNITAAKENGVMYNILVLIDHPSVRLSGCIDEAGKDNTSTSCSCCRTDKSDIPSLVGWYFNNTLLNQSQQCVGLLLNNLTNSEYSCQAVNLFGWKSSAIVYSTEIQEDDGMPEECSLDHKNLCSNQSCYNVNIHCYSKKNVSCIFSTIDERLIHNLCSQNKHSLLFLNGNQNCTVICKELIYSSNNHQAEVNQKLLALLVILPLIIFIVILCACRNKINQRCRLHLIRRRSKKSHDTLLQLQKLNRFSDQVDFDTLGKEGTLVKNMKEFYIKMDQASISEMDFNLEEETVL